VEERLGSLQLPDWVDNLKTIVHFIFRGWSFDGFFPKHGNGAVAEPGMKTIKAKSDAFHYPRKLSYIYDKLLEDGEYVLPNPELPVVDKGRGYSRLKFVPKSWKTSRSICMEPVPYQWAQQGARLVYEEFLSSSVLKNHVVLQDQRENQKMAQFGSKTNLVDTIDLSSASDSVSWALVKRVFPAGVLKHLLATRTSRVEMPNRSIQDVHKFAPMGSALCFPVQSTLYSAIVAMVSIAESYCLDWEKAGTLASIKDLSVAWQYCFGDGRFPSNQRTHHIPFRCYGDDITCDKDVTSNTIAALMQLGFKVNTDKSFIGSQAYRESCGKYYCQGHDVTPYFFKTKRIDRRINVKALAGIIDHANKALAYGFTHLRSTLINFVLRFPIEGVRPTKVDTLNPVLFSSVEDEGHREESMAIRCTGVRNSHLRVRKFDIDKKYTDTRTYLQRDEIRSITVGPRRSEELSKQYDSYFYSLWWRARYVNADPGGLDPGETVYAADTLFTGIMWRWTPT